MDGESPQTRVPTIRLVLRAVQEYRRSEDIFHVYMSTLWISFVVLQGNNIEPSTKLEYLFCTFNVGRCRFRPR